jgi:hypothetical protein
MGSSAFNSGGYNSSGKYLFRLAYGNDINSPAYDFQWYQTTNPWDVYTSQVGAIEYPVGFSAPPTNNSFGGLGISTTPTKTVLDGSLDNTWWHAVGQVAYDARGTPGPNNTWYSNVIWYVWGTPQSDIGQPDISEIIVSLCNSTVNGGNCYLFINGTLVNSQVNTTNNVLAGSNEGGTSKYYDQLCVLRDNFNGAFTNDAIFTSCELWFNEHTNENGTIPTTPTTILGSNTADGGSGVSSTINNATSCIIRCKFSSSLPPNASGILYEGGATGLGLCLYVYNGFIYVQGGIGSTSGGDVELSFAIPV